MTAAMLNNLRQDALENAKKLERSRYKPTVGCCS